MAKAGFYTSGDMVRIGCNDCKGCSFCCREMGESVVLTPYDMYELTKNLGKSFDELMADWIELYMTDGMAMPNLKMAGEKEICSFLNEEGRCGIHDFRPGLCRLFPLGRNYETETIETEDGPKERRGFRYFIVENSCPKLPGTKVKIEKWLGIRNLKRNEEFITKWHYFCRDFQERMQWLLSQGQDKQVKKYNISMLEMFYRKPYEKETDFYKQFEERWEDYKAVWNQVVMKPGKET